MGGNDKQGFGMKQGVLTASRVFLLMRQNTSGFQGHGRRKGERRRKACRGCIVSQDIAVLNLMIVKQGEQPIPGLTDEEKPRMRGPKRASKIRKLFNLSKEDDVRKYVIRRKFTKKNGKEVTKAPKIQRLVTPISLQRKRHRLSLKKNQQLKGIIVRLRDERLRTFYKDRYEARRNVLDWDFDGDGTFDCHDDCPNDADKVVPGICGCDDCSSAPAAAKHLVTAQAATTTHSVTVNAHDHSVPVSGSGFDSGITVTAGQTLTATASTDACWAAGDSPHTSDANGLGACTSTTCANSCDTGFGKHSAGGDSFDPTGVSSACMHSGRDSQPPAVPTQP